MACAARSVSFRGHCPLVGRTPAIYSPHLIDQGRTPMTGTEKRSAEDMALLERLEKLYVAVVADCLDSVGVRTNVLAPHVRSLYPGATVAGYALTVHVVEVDAAPADPGDWYR